MARYEVLTEECTLAARGATVDESEFADRNIDVDALIAGGHLREVTTAASRTTKTPTPESE